MTAMKIKYTYVYINTYTNYKLRTTYLGLIAAAGDSCCVGIFSDTSRLCTYESENTI